MKNTLFCILLVAGTCATSCTQEMLPESRQGNMDAASMADPYVEGRIIVKFDDDMTSLIEDGPESAGIMTKSSELNAIAESLGVKSMTRLFPYAGEYEKRTRAEGLHKWYVVEYDSTMVRTKASETFMSLPGVEIVEFIDKAVCSNAATSFFNDPYLNWQWHYYNDGTFKDGFVSGADINILPVWQRYTTGRDNVIVAVNDEGVDQNHEDLQGNLIGGKNYESPMNPVSPGYHGTHVAGIIAAVNNNGIGVCGIAGGDAAKGIKGVKIWSAQMLGAGNAATATAIKEGADYGAVISQNSWEYTNGGSVSQSNKEAIDYFIKYAGCDNEGNQLPDSPMKGGVVIFAAGNQWRDWGNPAGYDPVIAVGSINHKGERPGYSNYGPWVDICAPGGDGYVSNIRSTVNYNRYVGTYGTSMAAPHVSGVSALLVSYYGGPGFTNKMLEEKLIKGGRVKEFDKPNGVQLDALGSFEYGSTPPNPVEKPTYSVKMNTITMNFRVTADSDSGKAFKYIAVASQNREDFDGLDLKNLLSIGISGTSMVGDKAVGDKMSVTIERLEYATRYYVAILAADCYNNVSISSIYVIDTDSNRPPVITPDRDGIVKVRSNQAVKVILNISEPDNHRFSIDFEPGSNAATCKYKASGECVVTILGTEAEPGEYEAMITATDECGAESNYVLNYKIIDYYE